jgi:galactokinase
MTGRQNARLEELNGMWLQAFPQKPSGGAKVLSAPGRMEILGNHTDHQHGYVLTAAVDLDTLGLAAQSGDALIRLHSKGFADSTVDLSCLDVVSDEYGSTQALIRGVAAGFARNGHAIGGFDACTLTDVLPGSGLSSSASFEVWVATALNCLYNGGRIEPIEIAKICQYAENVHFGKPSGLQDQMACAVGGLLFIDFEDTENPRAETLKIDLSGYTVCIIDSGADHADLTHEYAAIPDELGKLCAFFGKRWLREVSEEDFLSAIPALRKEYGDRAILRAFHIFAENERGLQARQALLQNDLALFFKLVRASGESSFMFLRNVSVAGQVQEQALAVVLALAADMLKERGAFRIQGGGFAGTVEAFVPNDMADFFVKRMEAAIGAGSCHLLNIRNAGMLMVS